MENPPALPLSRRIGPILTLMFIAPMIAEVLPGATRTSALFVLPLEMCIWGGGAVLIRAAARHWKLGWLNMLLMALALSVAEECVIQQTSLAPMILQISPGEYARAAGVNYVYFLWALFYEATMVVFVPIIVAELIFRSRRDDPWLRTGSTITISVLFVLASFPAWYLWTQLVRGQVMHVGIYDPPFIAIALAIAAIVLLIGLSIGPARNVLAVPRPALKPLPPWALAVCAAIAAALWYGLVLLGFGIRQDFPPAIALATGLTVAACALYLLPRYSAHTAWSDAHRMALALGAILGTNIVNFAGFIYATSKLDLYGKIVMDVIGTVLLIWLALSLRRKPG